VRYSSQGFVLRGATGLAIVVACGLHMWATGGWLWRFPESIRRQIRPETLERDKVYTWAGFRKSEHPFTGRGDKMLLIGDSQAADFYNVLAESGRLDHVDIATIEVDMQCQALVSLGRAQFAALSRADRASCETGYERLQNLGSLADVKAVILAFNWDERGIPFITEGVTRLHDHGASGVFVVGRKSQGISGTDVVLQRGLAPGLEHYAGVRKNALSWSANTAIRFLHGDFVFIDLMSQVCPSDVSCQVLTEGQEIIFFDASHLSPPGARYLGRLLAKAGALPF
jgi:hypothetical protein